jgi:putative ABC transport system permease protein
MIMIMIMTMTESVTSLLLRRFALRHWQAAPKQSVVLVLILALGIAVFFSIRLANRAALASFQNFTDLITQQSDWLIEAPAGLLPDSLLLELRTRLDPEPVHIIPVLETTAARPSTDPDEPIGSRETYQVLGVDLISVQNLAARRAQDRSWFGQAQAAGQAESGRFWNVFRNPQAVFVSAALAARDGLTTGRSLRLVVNESIVTLEVAGIIPAVAEAPQAPATLLVMDLPALQKLTRRVGWLSRVEFIVPDGARVRERRASLKEQLERWSKGRWVVSSPVDRRESAATMTQAFRVNLTILSLIALLVGLYLIFQALDGAVVRRREEIGILRSLGVEERSIGRVWLLEAACLGLLGGALGALLGWAGAQFSVRLVGRTVNALYYSTSVQSARLDWTELVMALLLAVTSSLLAGWMPARAAARTPPAQILVRHALAPAGLSIWRKEWLGLIIILAGFGLVAVPPLRFSGGTRFPLAGYVAALCWILGGGILSGWALRRLAQFLRPFGRWLLPVKLAAGLLIHPSGRHRLAVAGLVCAIAMTAGMAILVASFDTTMRGWIDRTFHADLYIASSGAQSASTENRISPETWKAIAADPGVADINIAQAAGVTLPGGQSVLTGGELAVAHRHTRFSWVQPPLSEDIFVPGRNVGLALVSESFSERFQLRRGDRIGVPTPSGFKGLRIAGVFADYGNERGSIVVERRHFAEWFRDEHASGLMVFLRSGYSPESLRAQWLARYPGLRVFSNAHLRLEILRIFRQTFAITYALEMIGVLVAVAGLGLTLGSVLLDRRTELTTLRALGLNRAEMARGTALEGCALGVAGVATGLAVSLALGWMLIYVINKQTVGWTLELDVPWGQMLALAALVIGIGTAVAYGVGRWGAHLPADQEE